MLLLTLSSCVVDAVTDPTDAIRIAAVLPFTGEQAAIGPNLERMLQLVADDVASHGGIDGRPLLFEIGDSFSDPARGVDAAEALLDQDGIAAWLGPEEADLAVDLAPLLGDLDLVWLVPGVGSPSPRQLDGNPLRVNVGPSAPVMAGALSGRIRGDGVDNVAIIDVGDSYTTVLGDLLACEFSQAGGIVVARRTVAAGDTLALREIQDAGPDAIVLLAYPTTASAIVTDWSLLQASTTRWYLSPTLGTEEFVRNVPPGALDGAIGIEAQVEWYAGAVSGQFEEQWNDFPVRTAYYYHDAAALLSLALAAIAGSEDQTGAALLDAVLQVSSPPGELVAWDELGQGLDRVVSGEDVDYVGLTGPVDVAEGSVAQSLLGFWEVIDDQILHSALPEDYASFEGSACAAALW